MDLSAIGEAVLIAREGRRLKAYKDTVGGWTIGIGHTSAAGAPLVTIPVGSAVIAKAIQRAVDQIRVVFS